MVNVSIIIPCFNEEKYIASCLDSVIFSDLDVKDCEIILVDGGSNDKTVEIIKMYQKKYDFIKLIDNPKKIVPVAMNLGIESASGEYIFRLDAHASYPADYFSKLIAWHQRLDAENVGAVIDTDVKLHTPKSNAIKAVLSSRIGVGNSDFRTGVDEVKEVDTVPFGCYKKEVFEQYGYYDERLVRNQDIELNKRIINGGGKIYLVPDVQCTYYARENFRELAKNNFANGKWNILTAYYTGTLRSLSLRHFVPLGFVLSLGLPIVFSVFYSKLVYLSLLTLLSYLALVIIISLKLKDKTIPLLYLIGSFLTLHLSYGAGSVAGVFSVIQKYIKGDK